MSSSGFLKSSIGEVKRRQENRSGIGLSIIKHVAEMARSCLKANWARGVPSRCGFRYGKPRRTDREVGYNAVNTTMQRSIVEDDKRWRAASGYSGFEGYEVVTAATGKEGLQSVSRRNLIASFSTHAAGHQ
jgi:hypothetical protein